MPPILPWPLPFCTALYPVVFVPWHFAQWSPLNKQATLAHELVHHRQQKALGLVRFCFYYGFSKSFRWRIEKAGYRRQFWVLYRAGRTFGVDSYARILAGNLYWHMVDYATARVWLQQIKDSLSD